MHKNYARCRIGKRCILQTHDNKIFKSYTLLVAISSSRVVGWILFENGGTDTEKLVHCIRQHINSHYRNHLVIMDNAGAHRHPSVRQTIENGGNELLYSVPFFPRSNAIEHLFSQLKHYLRDAVPKSLDELSGAIRMTLQTKIKPKNLQGYNIKLTEQVKFHELEGVDCDLVCLDDGLVQGSQCRANQKHIRTNKI